MAVALDLDLNPDDISRLTSADALAAFFDRLGYSTAKRTSIPLQAVGLDGNPDMRHVELLSEDPDGFLRVIFAQLRSVTAKARNTLVRTFGQQNQDYLLVLTSDFESLEFVLIEKVQHQRKGPGGDTITKPQAKVFVVPRRWPQNMLRILRRLTFTARDEAGQPDGLFQFAKLKSVFDAAHYSGEYFQNRALFADHFLQTRLHDDPAWQEQPTDAFNNISQIMRQPRDRFAPGDEATARRDLYEPLFTALGFQPQRVDKSTESDPQPDYRLLSPDGQPRTVALAYSWERWLDGPDAADPGAPNENPGAAVVTLLERGDADWIIVTNGKFWRLYSRQAHSRSTNFYEVDLEDALLTTGQTDPNEAFRYWWLFFREQAFAPVPEQDGKTACWLDRIAAGSRDYAREVEIELKQRVFFEVVPQLAAGFLEDRRSRLKQRAAPADNELEQIREATLTLLYRILFLLYAESRDLLPVRESAYYAISLKKLKEEVSDIAGVAQENADEKLGDKYKRSSTALYDRLAKLFAVMDGGDLKKNRAYNVPVYNGGLFRIPNGKDVADEREARIAQFLLEHKVPDQFLASAIDRLARVPDTKTFGLGFVDYKSLGVRQLGSIYEGLLEFRLKIADEDLPPVNARSRRRATRLTSTRGGARDRTGVQKGEPYLANDRSERRATGSYYTPDHIVQYIVEHTVGPVLDRKLEALRPAFREAEKTYHREEANARANPKLLAGIVPQKLDGKGLPLPRSQEDFRAFALDKTYEKHRDLVEKLFDLKVLDPAMGSGHFLVDAVDFITDKLLDFLNAFPVNPVSAAIERTRQSILDSLADQGIELLDAERELWRRKLTDVHLIKRHVLKRCIYGVDLNPLATELAKVSLWLDAFTIGAPLSFLDHHVRVGNSLIGATVAHVQEALKEKESLLFGDRFAGLKLAAVGMTAIAAMPDATADQVKLSQREYRRASDALAPFKRILDAWLLQWFMPEALAKTFGRRRDALRDAILDFMIAPEAKSFFSASGAEEIKAAMEKLNPADRKLADAILKVADERRFFHWELEFPEAFYEPRPDAEQHVERMASAGFDDVIGNPPYLGIRTGTHDPGFVTYAREAYRTAVGNWDIFGLFFEQIQKILRSDGALGMIVPSRVATNRDFAPIRSLLYKRNGPQQVMECGAAFDDPTVVASVIVHAPSAGTRHTTMGTLAIGGAANCRSLPHEVLQSLPDHPLTTELTSKELDIFDKISAAPKHLSDYVDIVRGMECGKNDPHVHTQRSPRTVPVVSGEGVRSFEIVPQGLFIELGLEPRTRYKAPELFRTIPKLLVRFVAPHPIAAKDTEGYANFNTVYNLLPRTTNGEILDSLLLLLNSQLVRWWFRHAFNAEESLFPHIQKYQLEAIPVPDLGDKRLAQKLAAGTRLVLSKKGSVLDEAMERECAKAFGVSFKPDLLNYAKKGKHED